MPLEALQPTIVRHVCIKNFLLVRLLECLKTRALLHHHCRKIGFGERWKRMGQGRKTVLRKCYGLHKLRRKFLNWARSFWPFEEPLGKPCTFHRNALGGKKTCKERACSESMCRESRIFQSRKPCWLMSPMTVFQWLCVQLCQSTKHRRYSVCPPKMSLINLEHIFPLALEVLVKQAVNTQ